MRVIVCGSRQWEDVRAVEDRLDQLPADVTIIEGGAKGADRWAHEWAMANGVDTIRVPAQWDTHGPSAGPIRNREMLDMAPDLVIAFRSPGVSRGTDDMIRECARRGIVCEVIA